MRHLAAHKKKLGIGMPAEEEKLLERVGEDEAVAVEFEVSAEPTTDELIASIEDVIDQVNEALVALTVRVNKLEETVSAKSETQSSVTESLLKNPKAVIPIENVTRMIQNVLPSPMVERSWGFGPQRLCQELRGVISKLRDGVKQDE